jgi:hypothetical protein
MVVKMTWFDEIVAKISAHDKNAKDRSPPHGQEVNIKVQFFNGETFFLHLKVMWAKVNSRFKFEKICKQQTGLNFILFPL